MHTCYLLANTPKCKQLFTPFKIFTIVFSGLCHDVGHTGFTNIFEIASHSKKAITYNDNSVLILLLSLYKISMLLRPFSFLESLKTTFWSHWPLNSWKISENLWFRTFFTQTSSNTSLYWKSSTAFWKTKFRRTKSTSAFFLLWSCIQVTSEAQRRSSISAKSGHWRWIFSSANSIRWKDNSD